VKNALCLIALLCVGGCANFGRVLNQNMTDVPGDKGIILFSTESDRTALRYALALSVIDAERHKEVPLNIFVDASFLPSDFEELHGNVRSLQLNAGRYYVTPRSGNPYACLRYRPQFEFTVRAGEIVYIGSFRRVGNSVEYSPGANRERDIKFFLERNPALSQTEIRLETASMSRDTKGECD